MPLQPESGASRAGTLPVEDRGLLGAWDVDAGGRATQISWDGLDAALPEGGWRWIHLHREGERTEPWLLEGEMPPITAARAMLEEDTRPRYVPFDLGGMLILRGVNLSEGAEPEDMVSLRLFAAPGWVVTVVSRRLRAVDRLTTETEEGRAPPSPTAFLQRLVHDLRAKVEPVLDDLEEDVANLEIESLRMDRPLPADRRAAFTDARQDIAMIRRHVGPQGDALNALVADAPDWLESTERLSEDASGFHRIAEDLDALRERTNVLADEIATRVSERNNDIVLVLSVVSVVFLPITFVTGLMGMNVGGLPLTAHPWGFWLISLALALIALVSGWSVRRLIRRL